MKKGKGKRVKVFSEEESLLLLRELAEGRTVKQLHLEIPAFQHQCFIFYSAR